MSSYTYGAHVYTVVSAHVLMCVRRSEDDLECFSARAILGHLEAVSLTNLECANKAKCIDQQVLPLSPQQRLEVCATTARVLGIKFGSSCLKASTSTDWTFLSSL